MFMNHATDGLQREMSLVVQDGQGARQGCRTVAWYDIYIPYSNHVPNQSSPTRVVSSRSSRNPISALGGLQLRVRGWCP